MQASLARKHNSADSGSLLCRGFLHCALKPSNVLLDEQGRPKLAGLGLARTFASCQTAQTQVTHVMRLR